MDKSNTYFCIISNDRKFLVRLIAWLAKQDLTPNTETSIKQSDTRNGLIKLLELDTIIDNGDTLV